MNEINKEVIDVAFGNGCNAVSRVVIPQNPHNKNKTKICYGRTMGANEKVKKEKMTNIVREMKKHSLNILGLSEVKWKKSGDFEGYRFISVGGSRNG